MTREMGWEGLFRLRCMNTNIPLGRKSGLLFLGFVTMAKRALESSILACYCHYGGLGRYSTLGDSIFA